jgi:hypothetical protein
VSRAPRLATLAGGVVVILFGVWLLLDDAGTVGISFAAFGPALAAGLGLILIASGLSDRE